VKLPKLYFYLKHLYYYLRALIPNRYTNRYNSGIPVLLLHSVGDYIHKKDAIGIRITKNKFLSILDFITEHKFNSIFLREIGNSNEPNRVVLTFDDGYEDNYTEVLPLLEQYKVKATFFMAIGEIIKNTQKEIYPLMSMDSLKKMAQSEYVEIGMHAYYHQPFPERLDSSTIADLRKGIENFRETGIDIQSFSYPHGAIPIKIEELLPQLGIKFAACSNKGFYTANSDKFRIPRQEISFYSSLIEIKNKFL